MLLSPPHGCCKRPDLLSLALSLVVVVVVVAVLPPVLKWMGQLQGWR